MLLTDLGEIKTLLDIDPANTAQDKLLYFLIKTASEWIEQLINRPGLSFAQREEYPRPSGTEKLLLKYRPVRASTQYAPQVWTNISACFPQGASTQNLNTTGELLQWGVDYDVMIDDVAKQWSRAGILLRRNGSTWEKDWSRQRGFLSPFVRQTYGTIRVVYWAGYTADDLPQGFRDACNFIVARLKNTWPLGMELGGESYEERSVSYLAQQKNYLCATALPFISQYRNWRF